MKVTEKLVTKDHSKLVSAILADQVNRHQQLLLTWECPDVETAGMVERFIRHFDTPVACVEKRVEFSFPLLSLKELIARVKEWWDNDDELIASLEQVYRRHQIIWRAGRFTFDLTEQPVIYGILNVTPDSFYDGGKFQSHSAIVNQIAKMVAAGANVIEVGGQTTKPGGFKEVDPEEEIARIMPAIQLLRENYPQIAIAVDTYKLPVMAAAIEAGVDIINDVQAFNSKQKLILMAKANVGMVTMHSSRTHDYDNLTVAMQKFFEHNLGTIAAAGIDLERVILDQGIGYAKVADGYQDYATMRNIDQLNYLQRPIMVAISRKGFGQKLFNLAKEDRLGVTLIAETAMYLRGGHVLRVHDVEETSQLVKMIDTIENSYWFRSTSSQSQRQ